MRSPFSFIVRPVNGKRYDNVKTISNVDFLISVSKEDHKASRRHALLKEHGLELPVAFES